MKSKRLILLSLVSLLFVVGCDPTTKTKTVKGILEKIENTNGRTVRTDGWKILYFRDGRRVMVNYGPADSLYIGHYQEIKLNDDGFIKDVECRSYDKLVKTEEYQKYNSQLASTELLAMEKKLKEKKLKEAKQKDGDTD